MLANKTCVFPCRSPRAFEDTALLVAVSGRFTSIPPCCLQRIHIAGTFSWAGGRQLLGCQVLLADVVVGSVWPCGLGSGQQCCPGWRLWVPPGWGIFWLSASMCRWYLGEGVVPAVQLCDGGFSLSLGFMAALLLCPDGGLQARRGWSLCAGPRVGTLDVGGGPRAGHLGTTVVAVPSGRAGLPVLALPLPCWAPRTSHSSPCASISLSVNWGGECPLVGLLRQ